MLEKAGLLEKVEGPGPESQPEKEQEAIGHHSEVTLEQTVIGATSIQLVP